MHNRRSRLWPVLLVALVILGAVTGVVLGKYISTTSFNGLLTVKAELTESILLQESQALRRDDGSYELGVGKVTQNDYTLIPGLDIPKNPHIIITGKTSVDAYLFAEVVDATPNGAIAYAMSTNWKKLEISGKNGGTVYVYTGGGADAAVVDESVGESWRVELLQDNRITVGQKLLSGDTAQTDTFIFYASMGQVAAGATAEDVYGTIS